MWWWHHIQSSLPRGLGFVAPFYSSREPWKHLSGESPGEYAAIDALQTIRIVNGVIKSLQKLGMWEYCFRHKDELDRYALSPATEIGLFFSKDRLLKLQKEILEKKEQVTEGLLKIVPQEIVPWKKTYKTKRMVVDLLGSLLPDVVPEETTDLVYYCNLCEKTGVTKRHAKTKKCNGANLKLVEVPKTIYHLKDVFNPSSPKQVMGYLKHKGYPIPRDEKKKTETTDKKSLNSLAKKFGKKDPFFDLMLDSREIDKALDTYVEGMFRRMDEEDRVHPHFHPYTKTNRLGSNNPNSQNLPGGKKPERLDYGKKFKACVVASPGCTLIEADFEGVEAVMTGYFASDPDYMRLSKLGMHAFVTSHIVGKPASVDWGDEELRGYLKEIKAEYPDIYPRAKVCTHGKNYLLTAYGAVRENPGLFSGVKEAQQILDLIDEVAPRLSIWQEATLKRAHKQSYLGGSDHPYNYRQWFHLIYKYTKISEFEYQRLSKENPNSVLSFNGKRFRIDLGEDAKKAVAFYPQSTTGGLIKETCLQLTHPDSEYYIGDFFHGKTPLRMPIHDSVVLEVPDEKLDKTIETVAAVMGNPIKQMPMASEWGMGEYLKIGVEIAVGKDWLNMSRIKI
jgi:hypothetical protein